jgi:ribosomal protein S18 acetylase RimI-like enzyme
VYSIRLAQESDLEPICGLDAIAQQDHHRRNFITQAVLSGNCYVVVDTQVLGYGVLEYTFFENGFVSMVYVHPNYRQRGIGLQLMQHLEAACQTPKLFTSTNLSNLPMQSLLAKLGYRLSGVIHDLDEGDPELVYVNYLEPD